jgi:hypothetical protein
MSGRVYIIQGGGLSSETDWSMYLYHLCMIGRSKINGGLPDRTPRPCVVRC